MKTYIYVVLESDSVTVVEAIKRRNQKLSTLWCTYDEIGILKQGFVISKLIILEERATRKTTSLPN
jgi:hypothetical protein